MLDQRATANLMTTARAYLNAAKPKQAEDLLNRIIAQDHTHFEARLLLVYAYRNQGRISEGIHLARSLVGMGDDGQVYAILADCYYARMQIPEAVTYYKKALVNNPFNVDWLAQLICLHYENNEKEQALEAMDRGARLNPLHGGLWENIFLYFHNTENNTVMENQALAKLADTEIAPGQYYTYQAMAAEKEGQVEFAYDLYKKAFLVNPSDQNMRWQLTEFEKRRGFTPKNEKF